MPCPDLPELHFAQPHFHIGRNTSVRRGTRWHGVAEAWLQLPSTSQARRVRLRTELRPFCELTEAELACEHDPRCRTPAGLLAVMQQLYPGFSAAETVTLVHFELP